jgi:hypothetical protein
MTKKCFTSANLVIFIFFSVSIANASAGWYPTQPGEVIQVEFCVPKAAKSPVYLQLNTGKRGQSRNAYKVSFQNLHESSHCRGQEKSSGIPEQHNLLDLKFDWKVTVKGEYGLQLYIPNLHQTISGWPDGISSVKK